MVSQKMKTGTISLENTAYDIGGAAIGRGFANKAYSAAQSSKYAKKLWNNFANASLFRNVRTDMISSQLARYNVAKGAAQDFGASSAAGIGTAASSVGSWGISQINSFFGGIN